MSEPHIIFANLACLGLPLWVTVPSSFVSQFWWKNSIDAFRWSKLIVRLQPLHYVRKCPFIQPLFINEIPLDHQTLIKFYCLGLLIIGKTDTNQFIQWKTIIKNCKYHHEGFMLHWFLYSCLLSYNLHQTIIYGHVY